MKVMFDANVLLDVFQYRLPHYNASAACVNAVLCGTIVGCIPAHVLTTFYYVLSKYRDEQTARDAVRWLLTCFTVVACDHPMLQEALGCAMPDFEDAVVLVSAQHEGCDCILTRNLGDFQKAPLWIVSPQVLIETIGKG